MDGQTDGIAVANTALAMRALRRAVKKVKVTRIHVTLLVTFYLLEQKLTCSWLTLPEIFIVLTDIL